MIQKLSNNISYYICGELNYSEEKREVIYYGLQIVIGALVKILTIAILSLIFGVFKTTAVASITFIFFRRIIGGMHCETYNKCYFLSISLMLILGTLGNVVTINQNFVLMLLTCVYLLCTLITIKWVPMGTNKKDIRNPQTRLIIKKKTIALITIWMVLLFTFKNLVSSQVRLTSVLSILLAFIMATPLMKGVNIEV